MEIPSMQGTVEEKCTKIASVLGLDEPVSKEVMHGIANDPVYARNVMLAASNPKYLSKLLASPPSNLSTTTLIANYTKSLSKWAASSFTKMPNTDYQKRIMACGACPWRSEAPNTKLYQVAKAIHSVKPSENAICSKCGCLVVTKAGRATEECPDADPNNPSKNRWGQDLKQQQQ